MFRSIPSKESLWFNYKKLPKRPDQRWEIEDVIQLVFPKEFLPKQHEIAVELIKFMLPYHKEGGVYGNQIESFRKEKGFSNATLRNLVIPKLVRIGLLTRERVNPTGQTHKDKRHRMKLKLSHKFDMSLQRIGLQLETIIKTYE